MACCSLRPGRRTEDPRESAGCLLTRDLRPTCRPCRDTSRSAESQKKISRRGRGSLLTENRSPGPRAGPPVAPNDAPLSRAGPLSASSRRGSGAHRPALAFHAGALGTWGTTLPEQRRPRALPSEVIRSRRLAGPAPARLGPFDANCGSQGTAWESEPPAHPTPPSPPEPTEHSEPTVPGRQGGPAERHRAGAESMPSEGSRSAGLGGFRRVPWRLAPIVICPSKIAQLEARTWRNTPTRSRRHSPTRSSHR
jgi:hypothetical protein